MLDSAKQIMGEIRSDRKLKPNEDDGNAEGAG
jgi:hypothetical protein